MVSKLIFTLFLLLVVFKGNAQYNLKIKKEDNRFLCYQIGSKNDTILKNKSDLFYIKLPDSLKQVLKVYIENGKLAKTHKTNVYQLSYINGMKYSHSIKDTIFETLLEGATLSSKIIELSIINTANSKVSINNKFIAK